MLLKLEHEKNRGTGENFDQLEFCLNYCNRRQIVKANSQYLLLDETFH